MAGVTARAKILRGRIVRTWGAAMLRPYMEPDGRSETVLTPGGTSPAPTSEDRVAKVE